MKALNLRSLRIRLVAWYALLALAVMLGFGALTHDRVRHYLVEVQEGILERRCRQIAELLVEPQAASDEFIRAEIEARYAPSVGEKFVRISTVEGVVRYRSGPPNDGSFAPEAVPALVRPLAEPALRTVSLASSAPLMVSSLSCPTAHGAMLVEVGASMAGVERVLHALLLALVPGLTGVLAIGIVGGFVLIERALDPVRELMHAAHEISLRHLDRRLPVPRSGDEIEQLAVVLNQMIARLDHSFQNTARFTADASHELRTPLTIVRGELEALLRSSRISEVERDTLVSLQEEIDGLVRIVEGLFSLARLDAGEAQSERVRIDLGQLAETTFEQMCVLAEVRHIQVHCEARPVEVLGDCTRLKQVIVNLMDNAIKYTPQGGEVRLAVGPRENFAVFEISDSGPGVPTEALPHLFERFFRADTAHSREIAGAGLGLSIVQSICVAHGGSVSAHNREEGGCTFTVLLPRAG